MASGKRTHSGWSCRLEHTIPRGLSSRDLPPLLRCLKGQAHALTENRSSFRGVSIGRLSGASASVGLSPALWVVARCGRSAGGVWCGPCLLSLWGRGCGLGLGWLSYHRYPCARARSVHTHIYIYIYVYSSCRVNRAASLPPPSPTPPSPPAPPPSLPPFAAGAAFSSAAPLAAASVSAAAALAAVPPPPPPPSSLG